MTTNINETNGTASRTVHPEQSVMDDAQERVWVEVAERTEVQRAHAAGLITWDRPDPEAFYGTGDAIAYRVSPVPDMPVSAQHTVKRGRSKRGETRRVTARGVPYVIGDRRVTAHGDDTAQIVPGLLALLLDPDSPHGAVRARRVGVNALDVTRVTDLVYGPFGLEPLIGTDAESWSDTVDTDRSDAYRVPDTAHTYRPELLATRTVRTVRPDGTAHLIEQGFGHGTETVAPWPVRTSLRRVRVRRSEQAHAAPRRSNRVRVGTWQGAPYAWRHLVRRPVRFVSVPLIAPADRNGAVFYGHTLVTRSESNRTRVARRNRTIGTVRTDIDTAAGWEAVAEMLAAGERVVIEHGAASVTITRSRQSGRWSGTIVLPDGARVRVDSARTATAIGRRVHLVIG